MVRWLVALDAPAVVAGGWAVWHHGYAGRVTEDVDVVVARADLDRLKEHAGRFGFEWLPPPEGHWPKYVHAVTGIEVDFLPEGGRPGRPGSLAPTTIRHPEVYGATKERVDYIALEGLVELKLASRRLKDQADVVELIRFNRDRMPDLERYLDGIHPDYATMLKALEAEATD